MPFSRNLLLSAVATSCLLMPLSSWAQADYPTQPITIVVGFSAGGPSDTYARLLAEYLEVSLGQPVVVENRTGASTMLAGGYVASSEPDGYTLFFNTNTTYLNLLLRDNAPYDVDSFDPVGLMFTGAAFVVAPPDSRFDTLQDLILYARENPGELNYSTTGLGGYVHLTGEYFALVFDADINAVAYGGGAAALQGVMSGEVDLSFIGAAAAVSQISAERARGLAITEPERLADLPDIPTVDEVAIDLGMEDPNWDTGSWYGLLAPAGTPDEILDLLNAELADFVATDAMQERFDAEGNVAGGNLTPAEFEDYIANDMAIWTRVIEERGVEIE